MPRPDPEAGTASVWVAGAIATLLVIAGLLFALGSVVVVRHRATDAADLAALAAAGHADWGADVACENARSVVERMAVRLVSCRLERWDALVEVEAVVPGGLGPASARARAGPVPATSGCCPSGAR
jgi:secretion/DNA translocation related TadE-like protein